MTDKVFSPGEVLTAADVNNYLLNKTGSGNAIINGAFDIWQRGTTLSSAGFLADRFSSLATTSTVVQSRQTFSPAELNIDTFGDAQFYLRQVVTSGNTAGSRYVIRTRIEDVTTFAGQNVTLSFYAKAGSGTPKIGVEFTQSFGSGGSTGLNFGATAITIGTTWTRYTVSVSIPSISGKTVGSSSYLALLLWLDAGSDFASNASAIGNQSNTFDIWGVQIEAGPVATPFRRNANSLQGELAACQRYYQKVGIATAHGIGFGFATSTTNARVTLPLACSMRATPTIENDNATIRHEGTNFSISAFASLAMNQGASVTINATTGSLLTVNQLAVLSSDANFALSSEL
jgi:hypothetical protein